MKIEFNEQETVTLKKLLFIGRFLVNCNRKAEDEDKGANELFYKVLCEELKAEGKEPTEKAADEAIENIYDEAMAYISDYEKQSVPYALAALLAEQNYKGDSAREELMRVTARQLYEDELETKGVSIVKTDIPDFEEKVEKIVSGFLKK